MTQIDEQTLFSGVERAPIRYGMSLRKRRAWHADGDGEQNTGGDLNAKGDPNKDKGKGGDATPPGQQDEDGQNGGSKVTFTPEQQAHIQQIIDGTTKRQREKWEAELEAEKQKAKAEADRKRLEEEGKFKELNDTLTTDLESAKTELKTVTDERDAYKARVETLLQQRRDGLPEHLIALLDKLDPLAQLDWIAENAASLGQAQRRKGVPPTPRSDSQNGADKEQRREEAQKTSKRRYRSSY